MTYNNIEKRSISNLKNKIKIKRYTFSFFFVWASSFGDIWPDALLRSPALNNRAEVHHWGSAPAESETKGYKGGKKSWGGLFKILYLFFSKNQILFIICKCSY